MRGCSGGACVVAPGGGMRGCSWGVRGFCQGGMHGFSLGGHAWFFRGGACVVFPGGGVHRIRRDTVNERAVCILLECILV